MLSKVNVQDYLGEWLIWVNADKSAKFTLGRVVGYLTPIQNWNKRKKEEFKERKNYNTEKTLIYKSWGEKMAYNKWKTIEKFLEVIVFGMVGAIVSWASGLPPTETVIVCVANLKALENYLKHINDK